MKKKDDIRIDQLTKELTGENNTIEPCQIQFGFVGEHEDDTHIKLYLDLNLSQSIDLKKEDILHTVQLTRTHSPFGGTLVWYKQPAINTGGAQTSAQDYLYGDLYNRYYAQFSGYAHAATPENEEE